MPIRFPQEAGLTDARCVILRPFTARDVGALHEFFCSLPETTKRSAWDRIEARETVDSWAEDLDYEKAVSILALDGSKIVADATLFYRRYGPLRRVGRLTWLIDPDWHHIGVGVALITNFIQMARENGLRHLTCMLTAGLEDEAVSTLHRMGFEEYRISDYGTDADGEPRDMIKMVLRL